MPKTCIICGSAAGSREHPFPAAWGGRRTNRGIYCDAHNRALGNMAEPLFKQLAWYNARLRIRADHKEAPVPFVFRDPENGAEFTLDGESLALAEPLTLSRTPVEGHGESVSMAFGSHEQMRDWLAQQASQGLKVDTTPIAWVRSFRNPPGVSQGFGGTREMRAIGYVALTILAQHFPDAARDRALAPFREGLLNDNSELPVWWDFDPVPPNVPDQNFRFGHRVVVGIDAEGGHAYGRVELFATLSFAVMLGRSNGQASSSVLIDFDPMSETAKASETSRHYPCAIWPVRKPNVLTDGLQRAIDSGTAQQRFAALEARIYRHQLDTAVSALLSQIEPLRDAPPIIHITQIQRILLSDHDGRVLHLLEFVMNGIAATFEADPNLAHLAPKLREFIAREPANLTGLSPQAHECMRLAALVLSGEIGRSLADRSLDENRLRSVLGGSEGVRVIGEFFRDHLFR